MVVIALTSIQEVEASLIPGQPGLHRETPPPKENQGEQQSPLQIRLKGLLFTALELV